MVQIRDRVGFSEYFNVLISIKTKNFLTISVTSGLSRRKQICVDYLSLLHSVKCVICMTILMIFFRKFTFV